MIILLVLEPSILLNLSSIFTSLVDIGYIPVIVYHVFEFEHLSFLVDKINIAPRKRYGPSRKALVDEETALAPYAPSP